MEMEKPPAWFHWSFLFLVNLAALFQRKEFDRTTEAIVPTNEMWRKLNANMHQYVPLRANMGQHCSLSAVQRKTAFVEQSWWPQFNMFGSMPWCSFPWHKLLPRLAQKNCCAVYHLNLIHEFTSLFSPKVIFAGLLRKAFPPKHAFVAQAAAKIRPRPAQGLFSNERTWNLWS